MYPATLLPAIELRASKFTKSRDALALKNLIKAVRLLRAEAPRLFEALDEEAGWLAGECDLYTVGSIAEAAGELGAGAPAVWEALCRRESFERLLSDESAEGYEEYAAKLAWALCVSGNAGACGGEFLARAWEIAKGGEEGLSEEAQGQMAEVEVFAAAAGAELKNASPPAPASPGVPGIVRAELAAWPPKARADVLSAALTEAGFEHARRGSVPVSGDGRCLKVSMFSEEKMAVVDFLGPGRLLWGKGGAGTGSEDGVTKRRQALLRDAGWTVLSVPHWRVKSDEEGFDNLLDWLQERIDK
jgi:hypothetical protein